MGSLVLNEDERQQYVDDFFEDQQAQEGGILATINHLSDGDVPQEVLAVVGGEDGIPRSRLGKIVDGEVGDAPTITECFSTQVVGSAGSTAAQLAPPLQQLADSLAKILGPTNDAGAQTGGPKEAGRVVRGGP